VDAEDGFRGWGSTPWLGFSCIGFGAEAASHGDARGALRRGGRVVLGAWGWSSGLCRVDAERGVCSGPAAGLVDGYRRLQRMGRGCVPRVARGEGCVRGVPALGSCVRESVFVSPGCFSCQGQVCALSRPEACAICELVVGLFRFFRSLGVEGWLAVGAVFARCALGSAHGLC